MTTYGKIGSISTGTLRCADLIATFASELESLVQSNAADWCSDTGRGTRDQLMALVGRARESLPDDNDHDADLEHGDDGTLDDYVNELTEALEYFAAPYTRFGAHYGDGADFGFWACIDDLEEACRDDEALRHR